MLLLRKGAAALCAWLLVFVRPLVDLLIERVRPLREQLIEDARRAWRFWSLRFGAAALALQSLVLAAPDSALQAWAVLPEELKALLPVHWVNVVAAVLTAAGLVARVVKQKAPTDGV